jgi:signal transduction histidine kinase/ligand-binding sensor domain-containing protein
MTQFSHQSWGPADGIDRVYSIAQTKDGYLWLGTGRGLMRFDGVQFTRLEATEGQLAPMGATIGLLARRDGSLWSSSGAGYLQMRDGRTDFLPHLDGGTIGGKLLESSDGTIWAAAKGVLKFTNGYFERMYPDGVAKKESRDRFMAIVEDHSGTLWASEIRQPGDDRTSLVFLPTDGTNFILPHQFLGLAGDLKVAPDGTIWAAEVSRSVRGFVRDGNDIRFVTPEIKVGSTAILFDRDGALWISTLGDGLRRIPDTATMGTNDVGQFSPAADIFTKRDGLSDDLGDTIFQDREGNIWIGTAAGLDCFQETQITSYSVREGFPLDASPTLATSPDGSIWAGNPQGFAQLPPHGKKFIDRKWFDLPEKRRPAPSQREYVECACRTKDGHMLFGTSFGLVEVRPDGTAAFLMDGEEQYLNDVLCMSEARDGGLWVDDEPKGLGYLFQGKRKTILPRYSIAIVHEDSKNRLWMGRLGGGLTKREGTNLSVYQATNNIAFIPGEICSIQSDEQGRVLFFGIGGISRFDKGVFRTVNRRNGLPEDNLAAVATDDSGNYWIGGAATIFRITPRELEYAFAAKTNIISPEVYDGNDGLRGFIIGAPLGTGYPLATKGPDGKLWFSTSRGLAVIDPAHIPKDTEPPPVHIQKLSAAGKTYLTSNQLVFPVGTRSCEIDYAGLAFAKAVKVRYKYKLAGIDLDWVDAGTRRQALYQNLRAGKYKFQVLACNGDGIWNENGDSVEFRILPAFYETSWFPLLYTLPVALAMWGLYRIRLARTTAQIRLQLQGQIKERKRIAQELHDTLLQGFIGVGLQLDAIAGELPDSLADIRERLRKILARSDQYLDEARRSVWELRSASLEHAGGDFARTLSDSCGPRLDGTGIQFNFSVEGVACKLAPVIEDNLLRTCVEAVTNAVKHARPTQVQVNLGYSAASVRLRIRDNGCGFDPNGPDATKTGHFGLAGMRERVKSIFGTFSVNSQPGKGTEIIISVAARPADEATPPQVFS